MFRDCKKCGAAGLVFCVCAIGGEIVRSAVDPAVKLYVTHDSGDAQPHSQDREPEGPAPAGRLTTATVSTSASTSITAGLKWRTPGYPSST
jgi:hypothetical protein